MDSHAGVPPPPYTEQNGRAVSRGGGGGGGRNSSEHNPEEPPPYVPRTDSASQGVDDETPDKKVVESEGLPETSSSSSQQPDPESESASRPSSSFRESISQARQNYEEKKRAKEAAKKVDFYEKLYGFVPKNVMSEAEWKQAKRDAPKEKVPFKMQAKPWFGGTF